MPASVMAWRLLARALGSFGSSVTNPTTPSAPAGRTRILLSLRPAMKHASCPARFRGSCQAQVDAERSTAHLHGDDVIRRQLLADAFALDQDAGVILDLAEGLAGLGHEPQRLVQGRGGRWSLRARGLSRRTVGRVSPDGQAEGQEARQTIIQGGPTMSRSRNGCR